MIERQELYCHDCTQYVQFDVDLELDGNHVFNCPNCGHEHCRVVKNGRITDIRWDRRNGPTVYVPRVTITSSTTSTYDLYAADSGTRSFYLYQAWSTSTSGS